MPKKAGFHNLLITVRPINLTQQSKEFIYKHRGKRRKVVMKKRSHINKVFFMAIAIAALFAFFPIKANVYAASPYTVTITPNGNSVTITANCSNNYQLDGIAVDEQTWLEMTSAQKYSRTFDLSPYGTGYHTVTVRVWDKKNNRLAEAVMRKYIPVNTISARPNYNGRFEVYQNYFNYYPFNFGSNLSGTLYMEYSSDGGRTWARSGYMKANSIQLYIQQGYKIGGLRANTSYQTRIRYGENVVYSTRAGGDGKTYFFGGPILGTTTIKTGKSTKPAIKKVTAKAVNVKRRKSVRPGYYYWTGYHYIWMKPVKMRYYTYNVKVTVRLKKKPGTAGIWVNGRWLPGNKKKYTTKFKIPYPYNMSAKRPRGRVKYTVSVQTGQNKAYGGYSPTWKKRMKLK